MTSHELAKELLEGPDVPVILQEDAEGNGYSPLAGADQNAIYEAISSYSGKVWSTNWTSDEADMEPDEWEEFKKIFPPCVVLFPIN